MTTYKKITLRKGKEDSLKRFHPWVFSGAIGHIDEGVEEGDIVAVHAADGSLIGNGHFQVGSISVRMLTWGDEPVDEKFYAQRLNAAAMLRKSLGLMRADNNSFRLVHGEGDFLPGLVIDVYGSTAVLQAHSPGMHFDRHKEAQAIVALPDLDVRNVYYKSETTLPYKAALDAENGYIIGQYDTDIAMENGLRFHVDWLRGQKTGFFLDQKENRKAIRRLCPGKKVLDCFTHTGSFALNAGAAGAASVLGVDASMTGVLQAEENARLNGLSDRVRFQCADVFELLPKLEEQGERYDVVILDPPAFTKSRSSVRNAVKGYREINLRGMKLVKDGGFLATCSCSHFMDPELFAKTIREAARSARKRLRQVEFRTQAPDHPILWAADESYYLKFYLFQVRDDV